MTRLTACYALSLVLFASLADAGMFSASLERLHAIPCGDKAAHFLLAGILALLVNLSVRAGGATSLLVSIVPGGAAVALGVTCEEASNLLVTARNWSLGDLAANYLGILLLGVLPIAASHRFASRRAAAGLPVTAP